MRRGFRKGFAVRSLLVLPTVRYRRALFEVCSVQNEFDQVKKRGGFSNFHEMIKNISRVASHALNDGVHGGGQVGKETQSKSWQGDCRANH